jgi:hypothetical protein
MKFVWLIVIGLAGGLLVGQALQISNFSVTMLISAVIVAVIELVGAWRRARER